MKNKLLNLLRGKFSQKRRGDGEQNGRPSDLMRGQINKMSCLKQDIFSVKAVRQ